ncbi:DgyrCDS14748 [Dimorphilus gyrociliatus]|uniref:DgyrCDS14748 n=1 Tax=Dimorphilus gyrociliatus TaxID=2664684 RepID=A0A7I8WER7_9ANNE|nr:DgyrCDS14748 [Dimorphilus gyrociliatus]
MRNTTEVKTYYLCIIVVFFRLTICSMICTQPVNERIECGWSGISLTNCQNIGCCYNGNDAIPCFLPGGEIMLIEHTKTSGHPIEYAKQKYYECTPGNRASRAQVSGMYIWIISDKVQSQTCRSSQYQYSIEGDDEIIIGGDPYYFNDKTSSAFMSPLIPEVHLNLGIHSYRMIDNICKLGGLTEPERYSTCDNLTSDSFEQKFLYQIFEPANSRVKVEIRGVNFDCSFSNTEPYVMVYVKANTQYFNRNDLWSGKFLICTLDGQNGKCSYICNCGHSICKIIYLKWLINYDKSLNPLTAVSVCDISVVGI